MTQSRTHIGGSSSSSSSSSRIVIVVVVVETCPSYLSTTTYLAFGIVVKLGFEDVFDTSRVGDTEESGAECHLSHQRGGRKEEEEGGGGGGGTAHSACVSHNHAKKILFPALFSSRPFPPTLILKPYASARAPANSQPSALTNHYH